MLTTVDNAAALTAALQAALSGDTILLAPGTYAVSIQNLDLDNVTITSANLGKPAVISSLNLGGSSGIAFRDLEFVAQGPAGDYFARITGSQDIAFQRISVHGSLDGNPANDISGFLIRGSTGITIQDSEFQELLNAVSHLDTQHLTIRENAFHDLRTDGIRGGGSSNISIVGNRFYDFKPSTGDHPDAIQFWTNNTSANTHDILIANNFVHRGAGSQMQGVFMDNDAGGVFYERVVIEGNLISGGMYHGITVTSALNSTIRGNVVQGYGDMKSWIRVTASDGVVVESNRANVFTVTSSATNVSLADNTVVKLADDAGAWAQAVWREGRIAGAASAPVEPIQGGDARDTLFGTSAADRILAGADNDVIVDSSGANYLRGEDGDDLIRGGFDFDDVHGNMGSDTAFGGAGDDWVVGGKDNDSLAGEAGADIVYGNIGNDTVSGGAGNDIVRGGQDNDVLWGGDGADWLSGDKGDDTIDGGAGADTFSSFGDAGLDRINGFNFAEGDRIRLEPGSSYTFAQVGADVVVSLWGGGQVVLAGVSLSALGDGWIA